MNEWLPDTKTLFLWLLGAIVALGTFIGRRHLKDYDEFKKAVATRDELKASIDISNAQREQMSADRQRMHEENQGALERIEEQITRVHTRVDDVWKKVPWT